VRRDAAALLLVAATAVLLFLPSLRGEFVWDDRSLILENRLLDDWSDLGGALSSDFFRRSGNEERIGHWRPVVTLSYMVDRTLFGRAPAGYHAGNVLLHALASCLVFALGRALGLDRRGATCAGLLFAVHPVHVESVAWISGRTDLLAAVFALGALLLDTRRARNGDRGAAIGVFALTFAGLLAKEMAVAVLFGALLRALVLPSERETARGRARAALTAAAAPAAAAALYVFLRLVVVGIPPEPPAAAAAGRAVLFATWWSALLDTLRVLFWPADLGILPRVERVASLAAPAPVAGLAAFVLLAWGAWRARLRFPALSWAISFFLASLLPLTNFVVPIRAPAGIAFPWAERFLYLPSAGWALAAGAAVAATQARATRRAVAAAVLAAIALLAARSTARIPDWREERSLFGSEVERLPGAATAHLGLADALARDGETVLAERHYEEAIALAPTNLFARYNHGNLLLAKGDLAGAERAYREALAIVPGHANSRMNLGIALARQGRLGEAIEALERAVEAMPSSTEARHNLDAARALAAKEGGAEGAP
jgi:Tfp pilus assembly protein PilF